MWQRIQTLYLLIASGLLAAMLFEPYGVYLILVGIALAAQLLAIVCFKSRALQLRLSNLAALLLVGLQIWMATVYFLTDPHPATRITFVFPIVAAIFDFLAARGIISDELLVRSANRLRSSGKK